MILSLALLALASAATEDPICTSFPVEVLRPALITVYDDEADANPSRFVREERLARQFVKDFDVNKLNIKANVDELKKTLAFCDEYPRKETEWPTIYCMNTYESKRYFDGFAYGFKRYDWSSAMKDAGMERFRQYAKAILDAQVGPEEFGHLLANLRLMHEYKMTKKDYTRDLHELTLELNRGMRKIAKEKPPITKPVLCLDWLKHRHAQEALMNSVKLRLKEIVP